MPDPDAWRAQAACRGKTAMFYLAPNAGSRLIRQAKAICWGCPVLKDCREWALAEAADYGIVAGMTRNERRAERKSMAPCRATVDAPMPYRRPVAVTKERVAYFDAYRAGATVTEVAAQFGVARMSVYRAIHSVDTSVLRGQAS